MGSSTDQPADELVPEERPRDEMTPPPHLWPKKEAEEQDAKDEVPTP